MTLQDVLDRNWQHFIVQKSPPGLDVPQQRCRYVGVGPDGSECRCAIGVCLPAGISGLDDSVHVDALLYHDKRVAAVFDGMDRHDHMALKKLQGEHDRSALGSLLHGYDFHDDYEASLREWAEENALNLPDPTRVRRAA